MTSWILCLLLLASFCVSPNPVFLQSIVPYTVSAVEFGRQLVFTTEGSFYVDNLFGPYIPVNLSSPFFNNYDSYCKRESAYTPTKYNCAKKTNDGEEILALYVTYEIQVFFSSKHVYFYNSSEVLVKKISYGEITGYPDDEFDNSPTLRDRPNFSFFDSSFGGQFFQTKLSKPKTWSAAWNTKHGEFSVVPVYAFKGGEEVLIKGLIRSYLISAADEVLSLGTVQFKADDGNSLQNVTVNVKDKAVFLRNISNCYQSDFITKISVLCVHTDLKTMYFMGTLLSYNPVEYSSFTRIQFPEMQLSMNHAHVVYFKVVQYFVPFMQNLQVFITYAITSDGRLFYFSDQQIEDTRYHVLFTNQNCQRGYYTAEGDQFCTACPAGSFNQHQGSVDCYYCPDGTYSISGSTFCLPCPSGTHDTGIIATNSDQLKYCAPCLAGTFSVSGATSCTHCNTGFHAPNNGSSSCYPCPAGSIPNSNFGASACIRCPQGEFAPPLALQCFKCPPGQYSNETGAFECSTCERGTFANKAGLSLCSPCTPGYYADAVQSFECKECPQGSIAPRHGSNSCTKCASGLSPDANRTNCIYPGLSSAEFSVIISAAAFTLMVGFAVATCILVPICVCVCKLKNSRQNNLKDPLLKGFEQLTEEVELQSSFKVDTSLFSIPFEELSNFEEISDGPFGVVFKAQFKKRPVVVKLFKVQLTQNRELPEEFVNELKFYMSLRDKNIVYFYGACLRIPKIGIVMEHCKHGSVKSYFLKNKGNISDKTKVRLAFEISNGLHFLHSKGIIHRDIKSDNILIDEDLHAKITDFGTTKQMTEGNKGAITKSIGTAAYMAPEVIRGVAYNEKCDVFSFGIMLFEILTENFNPYGNKTGIEFHVASSATCRPEIPSSFEFDENWKLEYESLMKRCWSHEPSERPSFEVISDQLSIMLDDMQLNRKVFL